MPGKQCPKCKQKTLYKDRGENRKCTRCNETVIIPINNGRGGRGYRCSICNRLTVFNSTCNSCGAMENKPIRKK